MSYIYLYYYYVHVQYDRYQPLYQRIVNDEIPDTAAPPDGRIWKAGVAKGVTTNPYERRMALSGHRKPIVIGPKSIQVVVDGEGHTLANMVRDVAWTQYVHSSIIIVLNSIASIYILYLFLLLLLCRPDVVFAGYSLEHPVYRHMNLRIQTRDEATKSSEHVLVDSLKTTQGIMGCVGDSMEEAMAAWQKDS
jgi:DNA-directed RNA polymerase subunit L